MGGLSCPWVGSMGGFQWWVGSIGGPPWIFFDNLLRLLLDSAMAMYRSSPPFEPEKCLQPVVTVAIRAYDREASIIEGSALLDDNITQQWRQCAGQARVS